MPELDDSTLVAFVDGELDPVAMREVAGQVAEDPLAQEKIRLLRASASLVRAAFADAAYQEVPPAVAKMTAGPGSLSARAHRRWRLRSAMGAAALAAALVGFAGGVTLSRLHTPLAVPFTRQLLDEVAEYHVVYAQEPGHLDEISASHSDQIAIWFGKVLHRRIQIPDLSRIGLAFQGARLLVVDGRPVAQVLYAWPHQLDKPVGLCISLGELRDVEMITEHRAGVNLALWGGHGYTYVLVGWIGTGMLTELASELRPKLDVL